MLIRNVYITQGVAGGKVNIQGVAGGKVNILGAHIIGHSKQKCLY